jgi:hypothetical protein
MRTPSSPAMNHAESDAAGCPVSVAPNITSPSPLRSKCPPNRLVKVAPGTSGIGSPTLTSGASVPPLRRIRAAVVPPPETCAAKQRSPDAFIRIMRSSKVAYDAPDRPGTGLALAREHPERPGRALVPDEPRCRR